MNSMAFTQNELAYLESGPRRLARIATADLDGLPQVTPVGMWHHNPATDTIDVTGRHFATTRKYRNVQANPQVAIVIDDADQTDPWQPRAVIVQGPAEIVQPNNGDDQPLIRITPQRVISWGLD